MNSLVAVREYFELISRRDNDEWRQLGEMHLVLCDLIQKSEALGDLSFSAVALNIVIESPKSIVWLYWKHDTGFYLSPSQFCKDDAYLVSVDQILEELSKLLL